MPLADNIPIQTFEEFCNAPPSNPAALQQALRSLAQVAEEDRVVRSQVHAAIVAENIGPHLTPEQTRQALDRIVQVIAGIFDGRGLDAEAIVARLRREEVGNAEVMELPMVLRILKERNARCTAAARWPVTASVHASLPGEDE